LLDDEPLGYRGGRLSVRRCRTSRPGAGLDVMGQRYRAVRHLAGLAGPRILVSSSEASVEEHPWARQDSRDDWRRWRIYGAGCIWCVAARGVPGLVCRGTVYLLVGSLAPRLALAAHKGTAAPASTAGAVQEAVALRGTCHASAACRWAGPYALTSSSRPCSGLRAPLALMGAWRQRAVSSWGVSVRGLLPEHCPAWRELLRRRQRRRSSSRTRM
jgi:hypothetical protein